MEIYSFIKATPILLRPTSPKSPESRWKRYRLLNESMGFYTDVFFYWSGTYTFTAAAAQIVGISSKMHRLLNESIAFHRNLTLTRNIPAGHLALCTLCTIEKEMWSCMGELRRSCNGTSEQYGLGEVQLSKHLETNAVTWPHPTDLLAFLYIFKPWNPGILEIQHLRQNIIRKTENIEK